MFLLYSTDNKRAMPSYTYEMNDKCKCHFAVVELLVPPTFPTHLTRAWVLKLRPNIHHNTYSICVKTEDMIELLVPTVTGITDIVISIKLNRSLNHNIR